MGRLENGGLPRNQDESLHQALAHALPSLAPEPVFPIPRLDLGGCRLGKSSARKAVQARRPCQQNGLPAAVVVFLVTAQSPPAITAECTLSPHVESSSGRRRPPEACAGCLPE
jgi:hypothetical protein